MKNHSSRSFGTLGSMLPVSKINALSKAIAVGENHKYITDLHERMMELAKKMRLNLSNPTSYAKVLKAAQA